MSKAHEIETNIRAAAASEVAAGRHEDRYAAQMKSAGASMYAAFCAALKASPAFLGRVLDDKAILRHYQSTKPRPWWDERLAAAKFVDSKGAAKRQAAAYLIQWHVDPSAAEARHAQGKIQQLVAQKKLSAQRVKATRSMNKATSSAPTAREAQLVVKEAANAAHADRELPPVDAPDVTVDALLGELNRLRSAVGKIKVEQRMAVFEILCVTSREVERYVA